MEFEIIGIEYQKLKEHLDDLVTGHDLKTYRLKKVYSHLPSYWLSLVVNKRQWLKTWRDTGNEILNTDELIQQSFAEELQGMGFDNFQVRLIKRQKA